MSCTCNESYTCNECQVHIDLANDTLALKERLDWLVVCVKTIAKRAGVALPPEPQ